ncbi:MAG: TonB-dependent receptor [Wenzhouxiangellaceae bacterium]|nr:TonB-dependent receptor [Wenzhouxiangellaceae bacterium]
MIDPTTTNNRHTRLGRAIRMALISGLCIGFGVAQAQDQDEDSEEERAQSEETADLGSVQVTARRREENLRDVPISVTALSGEQLQDRGAENITYLNQVVPNATIEVSRGTSSTLTAFIRGVGQQDPVAGFEQGVGVYIDDVYLNRPQAAVLEVYDVERVEVLRGPQGTLYGRNTIGGAIKYVTKRLGREPSLELEGSLGNFSQRDAVIKAEMPIGDTFAVGGAVATFNRDGFGDNINLGIDNFNKDITAGRASAEWTPTYNLFVRLSGDYLNDTSNPVGGHREIPGLFSGAPVLDDVFDVRSGINGPNNEQDYGGQLLVEYDLTPEWTFKSITAYRETNSIQQIDFEALPAEDVDVPVRYENEQFTQELQLNYAGPIVAGVAGFYYIDAEAFNAFDVLLATTGDFIGLPGLNALTVGNVETESWSVFGDVSIDLAEILDLDTGLELSLGGRYTNDERTSRVLRQTLIGGNSEFFGGPGVPIQTTSDFNGSEEFTDFTPRISLAWQPTDNHNLYGSWSQGFKGGGFDPRGLTTAAPDFNGDGTVSEDEVFEFMKFEPEEVDTFEVGLKSSLFDRRVNTNLAFFYSDYTDIQIPGSVGVDTDGDGISDSFSGVTTNAGEATVKGVEFEATALLGRNVLTAGDQFNALATVGYIDAEFDEFIAQVTDPATGSTALEDVSDQRVFQNTPEWTAHVDVSYDFPVTLFQQVGSITVIGGWSYRGDTNQFEIPSDFLDQDAYSLIDASIIWKHISGKYELGIFGNNLTDQQYRTSGHQFVTPDGSTSTLGLEGVANAFFGPPRTVTATARVNF